MSPIISQLADAVGRDSRTLAQIAEATLGLTPESVGRKLRGQQPMTVDEAEALAIATGHELRLVRSRRK